MKQPPLSFGTEAMIPINGRPFGPGIFDNFRIKDELSHRKYFTTHTKTIKDKMTLTTLIMIVIPTVFRRPLLAFASAVSKNIDY